MVTGLRQSEEHIGDSTPIGDLPDGDLGPAPCRAQWAEVTTDFCRQSIDMSNAVRVRLDHMPSTTTGALGQAKLINLGGIIRVWRHRRWRCYTPTEVIGGAQTGD